LYYFPTFSPLQLVPSYTCSQGRTCSAILFSDFV
jgi:hypothetical protein